MKKFGKTFLTHITSLYKKLIVSLQRLVYKLKNLIQKIMAVFSFTSGAYVNQPPSQVGDYNITVGNRATTVLTLAMFTTSTTPPYSDPEGDAAAEVRIDSLPADGVIKLNGVPVTAGQVILVSDIVANNLVYESPDQDAADTSNFSFSVSDVGSGIFVG